MRDNKLQAWGGFRLSKLDFAKVIFYNIAEILTDLTNDVEWYKQNGDNVLFGEFVAFFNAYGQRVLNLLFADGFVVIGHTALGFRLLGSNEYNIKTERGFEIAVPRRAGEDVYVMRSETHKLYNCSDAAILNSWLHFLNNVMNGSNTITERFGSLIIGSPQELPSSPVPIELTNTERQQLEKELQQNYGSLAEQNQILILSRGMNFQTINMAGLDLRMQEKVRLAILAICDRLKVPANQVAIIDANGSKSFANGSELREGDFAKYQSFERLLNHTFVEFAVNLGLGLTYTIYNKPSRT